jgi:hypothetical protein
MAIWDVNGDGKLDVLFVTGVTSGEPELRILLGNGDGTFQTDVSGGLLELWYR